MTPDCQELDWHDTRADTRPRDPLRVHPALQCLPTRTQSPSIAARRPAAQPRSALLTGRDWQAGPAQCPSCAWRPGPRPRPRSVCHVVVVGLVPCRLLFALLQCFLPVCGINNQTHGLVYQNDIKPMGLSINQPMETHGLVYQIDNQTHGLVYQIDIKSMGWFIRSIREARIDR